MMSDDAVLRSEIKLSNWVIFDNSSPTVAPLTAEVLIYYTDKMPGIRQPAIIFFPSDNTSRRGVSNRFTNIHCSCHVPIAWPVYAGACQSFALCVK